MAEFGGADVQGWDGHEACFLRWRWGLSVALREVGEAFDCEQEADAAERFAGYGEYVLSGQAGRWRGLLGGCSCCRVFVQVCS